MLLNFCRRAGRRLYRELPWVARHHLAARLCRETLGRDADQEDFADSAKHCGVDYEALLQKIIALGLRYRTGA